MSISKIDESNYLSLLGGNSYELNWLNPDNVIFPGEFQRTLRSQVNLVNGFYNFVDPINNAVQIDITIHPLVFPIYFSICGFGNFMKNFRTNQSVLLADNNAERKPIHLTFNPPVSKLWTQVSAQGLNGTPYYGEMDVLLVTGHTSQVFQIQSRVGQISTSYDAPILGVQIENDDKIRISEVWIDVAESGQATGVQSIFNQVAINDLYFQI